jgi:hypothetical protein
MIVSQPKAISVLSNHRMDCWLSFLNQHINPVYAYGVNRILFRGILSPGVSRELVADKPNT